MIVPVKRARLFLLESEKDSALTLIQKKALMMITDSESSHKEDTSYEDKQIQILEGAIQYLQSIRGKKGFFEYHEVSNTEFKEISDENIAFLESVLSVQSRIEKTKQALDGLLTEIETYSPYKPLTLKLKQMNEAMYVKFISGFVHESNQKAFEEYLNTYHIPYEKHDGDEKGSAYTLVFLDEDTHQQRQNLKGYDFKETEFPNVDKTVVDYLRGIEEEHDSLKEDYNALLEEAKGYAQDIAKLYLLHDQYLAVKNRKLVPFAKTDHTIVINGWVRTDEEEALRNLLKAFSFELELFETNETPPTAIKNNKVVHSFEVITDSYNVPNHEEIDPNPIMSIWYFLFFSIFLGDIGYGALLVILTGLFLKLKKPKGTMKQLLTMFFISGFGVFAFGIISGSFFGESVDVGAWIGNLFGQNWTSIFIDTGDTVFMLVGSLALGILHILTGLVMKVLLSIKLKDYLGMLADGVSWILVLLGVIALALDMMMEINFNLTQVGFGLMIAGGLLVLFLAGREKKGIFSKITSGIGGLYGASGYLGDILSYSRVIALVLSTSVIATTFNLLIGMVIQSSIIGAILGAVLLVVAHLFNFAMGLLSAYIHDARLQYIEFYGKFYIGEGYKYDPLQIELKYLDNIIIGGKE